MFYKILAASTCLAIIPGLMEIILKKYKKVYSSVKDNSNYTCVFITPTNAKCRQHIYDKVFCGLSCSYVVLKDIVDFIASATESISLCMLLLTSHEICATLIKCHKEGKIVRVILDKRMWGCSGSKGIPLQRNGVLVRVQEEDNSMMHHKFCLIDENTPSGKLFIGTANITLQGFCSNWDTVVYNDNKDTIGRLKAEFDEMWFTFLKYNI